MMSLKERLERLSIPEPNSGCQIWLGSIKTNPSGIQYGRISVGSKSNGTRQTLSAHRVSYQEHRGPIPDGHDVCHHCDVGLCINADHLFTGTHKANMADASRKGRMKGGIFAFNVHGEKSPSAKWSDETIAAIKDSKEQTKVLAERHGMSRSYIRQIRNGLRRPRG